MDSKSIKLNICYGCMNKLEEGTNVCPHCGYVLSRRSNPQDALPEGTVLSRKYLVGRVLGRGGFGVTYLGFDLDLQIRVAIKEFFPLGLSSRSTADYSVLPMTNGEDEAFSRGCAAFLEEARTLAAFNNPHIVRVRDYFREHGTAYLVMDYVEGKTLSREIMDYGGKVPPERLLGLMKPLILQLDKLHKKNIIHRDIAPDNLVIVHDEDTNEEHFVLLDFGAARSFVSSSISQKYTATVKNGYAPIEQYSQKSKQGPYTDVYALCATIYAALTGVVPPSALERSADGAQIEPLSKYGVSLPDYVEQAILHGLAQNAEERTQTMKQLYEELTTVPDARELEYKKAQSLLGAAVSEADYRNAEKAFEKLGAYKDAASQAVKSKAKAEECHKKALYAEAKELMAENTLAGYEKAIKRFSEAGDWQDSRQLSDLCQLKVKDLRGDNRKPKLLPILLAFLVIAGTGIFAWKKVSDANEKSRIQQEAANVAVQQAEDALKETQEKLKESEQARTAAEAEAEARTREAEEAKVAAEAAEKARADAESEAQAKTKEAEDAKAMAESAEKAMAEARAESEAKAEEVAKARAEAESRTTEAEQAKAEAEAAKKSAEEAKALAEAAERKAAETEKTAGASAKEAEDALKEAREAAKAAEQKAAEAEALAQARAAEAEKAKAEAESAAKSAEEAKAAASAAEQRATEATEARTAAEQRAAEATEAKTTAEQKAEEAATAKAEAEQKAEEATAAKTAAEQKATEAAEAKQEAERKAEAEAKERKEAEEKETAYYNAISLFTSGSYEEAKEAFLTLDEYRDSKAYVTKCDAALEALEKEAKATPVPTPVPATTQTPKPTPTSTPVPTSEPTPAQIPVIANRRDIKVGDYIKFGSYEQDNDLNNGKEPIEWLVLDVQEDTVLLMSRYGLDSKRYDQSRTKLTWKTCSLRAWLNEVFFNTAFSSEEQAEILSSAISIECSVNGEPPENLYVNDKVFLLSQAEADKYLVTPEIRNCKVTNYSKAQGAMFNSDGNGQYWLRNTHYNGVISLASYNSFSRAEGKGNLIASGLVVRPALWVEKTRLSAAVYSDGSRESKKEEETSSVELQIDFVVNETIQEVHKGETIFFGHYWQNSIVNGKEPIEWIVLDTQDGKAFLVSKYALDCKNYGFDKQDEATWGSSYIRFWLNNTFLSAAFNTEEQQFILESNLENPANSKYGTSSGEETTDRIFLLSNSEVEEYFKTAEDCACMASQYVKKTYEKALIDPQTDNCWWWTRTSGAGSRFASGVTKDGLVHNSGNDIHNQNVCVRPAMWVSEKCIRTSTCTFGSYEQDNDLTNGKEPIEWQVLDIQDNKALLISKFGLDVQPYNNTKAKVTWDTCSLRSWLNKDFLNTAFTRAERDRIIYSKVPADIYVESHKNAGNDTFDGVFLLSISELEQYYYSDTERQSEATEYAKSLTSDKTNCWWLRSTGYWQSFAAYVYSSGVINGYGASVNAGNLFIRPAIWVSIEDLPREAIENIVGVDEEILVQEQEFITTEEPIQSLNKAEVGDYVTFGTYEQDNDLTNGKEPIEWIVLDKNDGKALLLSKYVLDFKPYTEKSKFIDVTWDRSTMRKWLNDDFVRTAFDQLDSAVLVTTTVDNSKAQGNSTWSAEGGENTLDRVFLLSYAEANKYFESNTARLCTPTVYATTQGVVEDSNGRCRWWLRSPGFSKYFVAFVRNDGVLGDYTYTHAGRTSAPVRPALWINIES